MPEILVKRHHIDSYDGTFDYMYVTQQRLCQIVLHEHIHHNLFTLYYENFSYGNNYSINRIFYAVKNISCTSLKRFRLNGSVAFCQGLERLNLNDT